MCISDGCSYGCSSDVSASSLVGRRSRRLRHMPLDLRDKVGQGHRLGLEIHAADGDALAAVAFEGMGGEGDDGDVARSVLAQYLGRRFPSVHFAERDVHEDDVGLGALRELNPFGAAVRADGVIALPPSTPLEHVPIHLIVFYAVALCHDATYDTDLFVLRD